MSDGGRIQVRIASDGLTAEVVVVAGAAADVPEVHAALQAAGVTFGVDEASCMRLGAQLGDEQFCSSGEVVARGVLPTKPEEARLELLFHPGLQPGHLRDDGSMDYWDRELLKSVAKGDTVARAHAAKEGTPGHRVDGVVLPADPLRGPPLRVGDGVEIGGDGAVRARRAGVVVFTEVGGVDVVDRLVHAGDVDLHSGHLKMEGSVVVKGSVARLFNVRATGDVDITGGVDGGSVYAGGNLAVRQGVRTSDVGMVCAEGDMAVHHAEGASLSCGGNLKIEDAVNCQLMASTIHVLRRLRGGSAVAETKLTVGEAGSPAGHATMLAAGDPVERPVLRALRDVADARTQRMAERRTCSSPGGGPGRCKGGKFGRANMELEQAELERKIERARRRAHLVATATIQVQNAVYAGVTVRIGDWTYTLDQSTRDVCFSLDDDGQKIVAGKAKP
jgi:uncharacterized protein (DUF342 family)